MAMPALSAAARRAFTISRVYAHPSLALAPRRFASDHAPALPKDDGLGIGDYNVPYTHAQYRNPRNYKFDPQERRELEDPLPEDDEALSVWSADNVFRVSHATAFRHLMTALGGLGLLLYAIYLSDPESRRPTVPPSIPKPKPATADAH